MVTHSLIVALAARARRPSAGVVVATIALALSVTGNAAAAIIIGSNSQVAANTISGHHPPAGEHANIIAGSVTDADLARLPVWRAVHPFGSAQPAFTHYFKNSTAFPDFPRAAFYKWHGEVHLKGSVCASDATNHCYTDGSRAGFDDVIFTLPKGYRPAHTVIFRVASGSDGDTDGTVYVQAGTGNVVARTYARSAIDLDSISFRVDN